MNTVKEEGFEDPRGPGGIVIDVEEATIWGEGREEERWWRRTGEFPGEELVEAGIRDLERGVESVEALLVSIGAPRLRQLGLSVPSPFPEPEPRLYERLRGEDEDGAHSRYNALVRRLVSFERAAECAS